MKFLILLLLPFSMFAQEFPESWQGNYVGTMVIGFNGRPNDSVNVTFELNEIHSDSVWSYKTTFNSEKFGVITKDYQIVRKEKENNHDFILDEQNGILMDMTFMNGTLYGMYQVLGQMYVTTARRIDGQIYIDLFAAPTSEPLVTKAEENPSDESEILIEASSYKPRLHQTVLLTPAP